MTFNKKKNLLKKITIQTNNQLKKNIYASGTQAQGDIGNRTPYKPTIARNIEWYIGQCHKAQVHVGIGLKRQC